MIRIAGEWGRTTIGLTLGPERRDPLSDAPEFSMYIDDDLRKTVVFFGFHDRSPDSGGILCVGTGFLIGYDGAGYLVTAKHLAHGLADNPFLVRANTKTGSSINLPADNTRWYEHPDPNVDVAAIPFTITDGSRFDLLYLPAERLIMDDWLLKYKKVGVGDLTYTIGLFRLLHGKKRNLPIVHSGSIAMMPSDELIPVKDWRPLGGKIFVEGYLVESNALEGLSGSPVFLHPTTTISTVPHGLILDPRTSPDPNVFQALMPTIEVGLLGMWTGSWDAPPDEIMAAQTGRGARVPVGVGIVVPASKIIETLNHEELKAMRTQTKAAREELAKAQAATPDSAMPLVKPSQQTSVSSSEVNPSHREDFTRLLGAAARSKRSVG